MLVVGATSLTGVITVLFFMMDFIEKIHVTDLTLDLVAIIFSVVCVVASAMSYCFIEGVGRVSIIKVGTLGMGLSNVGFGLGMFYSLEWLAFVMICLYF